MTEPGGLLSTSDSADEDAMTPMMFADILAAMKLTSTADGVVNLMLSAARRHIITSPCAWTCRPKDARG
jgi:hypothetical protein